MADYAIISKELLNSIGDAIRKMRGKTGLIPTVDMPSEIESIETGFERNGVTGVTLINSGDYLKVYFSKNIGDRINGVLVIWLSDGMQITFVFDEAEFTTNLELESGMYAAYEGLPKPDVTFSAYKDANILYISVDMSAGYAIDNYRGFVLQEKV